MDKDLKEILLAESISIAGGIFAGTLLAYQTEKISLLPGLFILLPGFLEMKGNISGSLSARLSSALHLGTLEPAIKNNQILKENVMAAFILNFIVSFILGVLAFLFTLILFKQNSLEIILVSLIAAFFSSLVIIPVTVVSCFVLYKKGFDPDNIMSPLVSTLGDFVSVASLLFTIWIIL